MDEHQPELIDVEQAIKDCVEAAKWPATRLAFVAGVSEGGAQKWLDKQSKIGGLPLVRLMRHLPGLAERLIGVEVAA